MSFLKGGAKTLGDVLERAIRFTLPAAYQQTFASRDFQSKHRPSISTLRFYEIALDVAMLLVERERRCSKSVDCARFDWSDSSPGKEYDWLWSMFREIGDNQLIDAFEASVLLERWIKEYVCEVSRSHGDNLEDLRLPVEPLPEWKPLLHILQHSIY